MGFWSAYILHQRIWRRHNLNCSDDSWKSTGAMKHFPILGDKNVVKFSHRLGVIFDDETCQEVPLCRVLVISSIWFAPSVHQKMESVHLSRNGYCRSRRLRRNAGRVLKRQTEIQSSDSWWLFGPFSKRSLWPDGGYGSSSSVAFHRAIRWPSGVFEAGATGYDPLLPDFNVSALSLRLWIN